MAMFGDGAVNQGVLAESMNMAELWHLPVIFFVLNNQYGMGTAVERASAETDLFLRAEAFGMPARQVDGMDVMAVHAAVVRGGPAGPRGAAAEHDRGDRLPVPRPLDERPGHHPRGVREGALAGARPPGHLRARPAGRGRSLTREDADAVRVRAEEVVAAAAAFAEESPEVPESELARHLYARPLERRPAGRGGDAGGAA